MYDSQDPDVLPPDGSATAGLLAQVVAALRMARWSGVEAVPRVVWRSPAEAERRQPVPQRADPQPGRGWGGDQRAAAPAADPPNAPTSGPAAAPTGPIAATAAVDLLPAAPPLRRRSVGATAAPSAAGAAGSPAGMGATAPGQPLGSQAIAHDPTSSGQLLAATAAQVRALQSRADVCVRCPRHTGRARVVHGEGAARARLLVLLEAPSAADEAAGRPATGVAGALLDAMLAAMGLSRDAVWLTHLCLCRDGDRAPTMDEATACSGWLRAQWELVQPAVILAMGELPAQLLARQALPLDGLRGRWMEIRGTPALATWSPHQLLEADKVRKREAWDDLRLVMARLGLTRP